MIKIQIKRAMALSFFVYAIEISVIRNCFVLRDSNFGFQYCLEKDEIQFDFILSFFTAQNYEMGHESFCGVLRIYACIDDWR